MPLHSETKINHLLKSWPGRVVQALRGSRKDIDENLLPHLSPLGWEHINLTGDYVWHQGKQVKQGEFRPLLIPWEA